MSTMKSPLEQEEAKRRIAEAIAAKSGVIEECKYHTAVYIDKGDPQALQNAYEIARSRFAKGDGSVDGFENIEELMDMVKSIADEASEECYCCKKYRYE